MPNALGSALILVGSMTLVAGCSSTTGSSSGTSGGTSSGTAAGGGCVLYNNGFNCVCGEAAKFQKDGVAVESCSVATMKTPPSCAVQGSSCMCVPQGCHDDRGPSEGLSCACGVGQTQALTKCIEQTGTTKDCVLPTACPSDTTVCCQAADSSCTCSFASKTCATNETVVPTCTAAMIKPQKTTCP